MLKLHIGAFDQILPGWLNTDITPHLYLARVPGLVTLLGAARIMDARRVEQHRAGIFRSLTKLDFTRRFPFPDGAVDAIYGSHMLASIRQEDAQVCLNECFRVLKPGGVVRMAVVDLDAAVASYSPAGADQFMELIFCLSTSRRAKNRNWWHYNETSLGERFRRAGFQSMERCAYRQGRCPDVERIDFRPGSLIMEAYR